MESLLLVIIIILGWLTYRFNRFLQKFQRDQQKEKEYYTTLYPVFSKAELEVCYKDMEKTYLKYNELDSDVGLNKELKAAQSFLTDDLKKLMRAYFDAKFEWQNNIRLHRFMIEANIAVLNGLKTIEEAREQYNKEIYSAFEHIKDIEDQMKHWEAAMTSK